MIIMQLDKSEFEQAFVTIRPDNFSRLALSELYDYLDQLSDDIGEDFDLDVIAICCDWAECDAADLCTDYGYMLDQVEDQTDDEYLEALIEELEQNTTIIKVEHFDHDTYLVQAF
jgi:hypothetical protein